MSDFFTKRDIDIFLFKAIFENDIQKIRIYLDQKVDISDNNRSIYGETALTCAVKRGVIEIVNLLLENGAHINEKDIYGHSSLMVASNRNETKIVPILLKYGANIYEETIYGFNSINIASNFNNLNIIDIFNKWSLTMLIIVLQELYIYHMLDCSSYIDIYEYIGYEKI